MCFSYLSGFTQINKNELFGIWTKTKIDMKDGSQFVSFYPSEKRYIEFDFRENQYFFNIYPAIQGKEASYNYVLKGNKIIVSQNFEYIIEKLDQKSLIIVEQMQGLTDDKLKRYHLTRKSVLRDQFKKDKLNNSVLNATQFYTPKYKGNLTLDLNKKLKNQLGILLISGTITIQVKTKTSLITVSDIESTNVKLTNSIIKTLEKAFKKWDLRGFEDYNEIIIPFIISVKNKGRSRMCKIKLFSQSIDDLNADYGKPYENMTESGKYFNLGIKSYSEGSFENATEYFSKSIEWDHSFIDALYNRAAAYYANNQQNLACKDWHRLTELGQVKGKELLNEHCK
jgi:tetratricopeptide (TPR) repeat protein